jgi:hypothetical protein
LQIFLYVQASNFARLPDRSYRWAYCPRAAETFTSELNMLRCLRMHRTLLAIRIQAIDGMGTHTPLDSQPCRLLQSSRRYLCESFPGCLGPWHGGSAECTCLSLPPRHRPSPVHYQGRLPALFPSKPFHDGSLFRDCSHFVMFRPPSLLASPIVPTAATHRRRAAEAFTSEQNMLRCLRMHRIC